MLVGQVSYRIQVVWLPRFVVRTKAEIIVHLGDIMLLDATTNDKWQIEHSVTFSTWRHNAAAADMVSIWGKWITIKSR